VRASQIECAKCPRPEILPENDTVVALYRRSQTQWSYTGSEFGNVRTGMNYPGVEIVAKAIGVQDWVETLDLLQVIEFTMLDIDREQRATESARRSAARK